MFYKPESHVESNKPYTLKTNKEVIYNPSIPSYDSLEHRSLLNVRNVPKPSIRINPNYSNTPEVKSDLNKMISPRNQPNI
jgi:hypothetical protein